jgi:hypothetical protein
MAEVFSVVEAARRLGVPAWKVPRLFELKRLPPPRRVGSWRVLTVDDLAAIAVELQKVRAKGRQTTHAAC